MKFIPLPHPLASRCCILSMTAACIFLSSVSPLCAQAGKTPYDIKKITADFVPTPEYSVNGPRKRTPNKPSEWLEIEVEFESKQDFTEELTFNYYILIGDKLLVGEVTHADIAEGRGLYSVMYVSPRSLYKLMEGKSVSSNDVKNVAIEIRKQGAIQDIDAIDTRNRTKWWETLPQVPGLVVSKDKTPFAPLFWDRYEAIKIDR